MTSKFVCRSRLFLALITFFAAAPFSLAQTSSNGAVRGYVRDEQKAALRDVALTATSPDAPGAYTAVSDDDGFYRLLDLPPGRYTINAQRDGFATFVRENITVRAGMNLGLDITMSLGSIAEVVTVKADTPMLESRSAGLGVNISGDFQRALPLTTRHNWADFLLLTPGTVHSFTTVFPSVIFVHGADSNSQAILLDGADIAPSAQSSIRYHWMSSDVLHDVQVQTAGIEAAAPLGHAGVINMISQSGTNQPMSRALVVFQRENWASNNNPGATTSAYALTQPDVSIGGPIRRDRAWFFGSYRFTRLDQSVSRTAEQIADLRALVPSFDPWNRQITNHQTFAKTTIQQSARQRVEMFHQYGRNGSASGLTTDAAQSFTTFGTGHSVAARLFSGWNSSLTTRFGAAFNNQTSPLRLSNYELPQRQVHRSMFLSAGRAVGTGVIAGFDNGNTGVGQDAPAAQLNFTGDLTFYHRGGFGTHEMRAGFYLQPLRLVQFDLRYTGQGFAMEDLVLRDPANPAAGTIPFYRRLYNGDRVTSVKARATDYAVYFQDAWRPTDRLTISAGLRVDKITVTDKLFDVTVQDTTAIGPRIGVNYQLTNDGRNTIRSSWGRVHDAVAGAGAFPSVGAARLGFRDLYDLDLDGVFETEFVTPNVTALTLNREIDVANYRQPRMDEFLVGYQRQLPGQTTIDASLVHRYFKDQRATVEVNGLYENGLFLGYRDEAFNEIFRITSDVWNWWVYSAFQFQATKRLDRMQILASYVRQWRHIAGTWQPNDPASFIQPDAFPNDRGIGNAGRLGSSSLSGTDMTASQQWRDHAIRVAGAFRAPWGMQIASTFILQSGQWSGPVVGRLAAPEPRFGPATVRLSNGRVVSNPLATTIRFAHPTRADGQFRLPWISEWNLHVGREFGIGRVRVEPGLDVLNLLNRDADQGVMSGSNQMYSPNFRKTIDRQPPRSLQVSVRLTY